MSNGALTSKIKYYILKTSGDTMRNFLKEQRRRQRRRRRYMHATAVFGVELFPQFNK